MHHRAAHPRQLNGALQRALAATGFNHHVVSAGRDDGVDALTSFVLVQVARFYGDLRGTQLLSRRGRENADGTRTNDGDPGLRADLTLVAAVPCHARRLHQRCVGDLEAWWQRHEYVAWSSEPLAHPTRTEHPWRGRSC